MQTNKELSSNFTKVVRIGTAKTWGGRGYSIFCTIKYYDGKLSITGVEGPLAGGNCLGGCGQIDMSLEIDDIKPAPGWTKNTIRQFLAYWDKWHLNDMNGGSPRQTAYLETIKYEYNGTRSHYEWAKEALESAGLQPDAEYLHNDKPYSYGSAWLSVEVPAEVITFMLSLPDTDKTPAWN